MGLRHPTYKVVAADRELIYSAHHSERAAHKAAEYRRIAMDQPACLNITSSVLVVDWQAKFNKDTMQWELP